MITGASFLGTGAFGVGSVFTASLFFAVVSSAVAGFFTGAIDLPPGIDINLVVWMNIRVIGLTR